MIISGDAPRPAATNDAAAMFNLYAFHRAKGAAWRPEKDPSENPKTADDDRNLNHKSSIFETGSAILSEISYL